MPNYYPRRIQPADSLLYDAQGNLVGLRSGTSGDEAIFGLSASELAATQALVSAPWNQSPVSFDAAVARMCVFGQFNDGGYLCTDGDASRGNFATRLYKLVGDPTGAFTATAFAATATVVNLKDTTGAAAFNASSGLLNAWVASNGDMFYMWLNSATNRCYLHRAKAGTGTVGTDAGYSNNQACIDIGRMGGTHSPNIRAFSPRGFLDFRNSAGQRTILFTEYNINGARDMNGGVGDQAIVWRSLDGGATFSVFLELNTAVGQHRIDHWHGVTIDPYTGMIYFLAGDNGDENAILQWDGVSAAWAANSTWAQIAATPGWKVRTGSELLRYTDILFSPTCIYSIPDCDTEAADGSSTAFVSTVIDKSLQWVGTTAAVARQDNIPPAIAARGPRFSAIVSFIQRADVRYLDIWTIDGQPENGASWSLVTKLRTYKPDTVVTPRSFFVDQAGDLWCGGLYGTGTQFVPLTETQSGSSVRLRPVARRAGVDVYNLT